VRTTRYGTREAIGLPFVTALQALEGGERAVLLLRDVAGFPTAEVADMVGLPEDAVDPTLHRARSALEARLPADREPAPLPGSPRETRLAGGFADAFVRRDVAGVCRLLADDVLVTTPPEPTLHRGRLAARQFLYDGAPWREASAVRLVPTRANGQPAFGCYVQDEPGDDVRASALLVLTLVGDHIAAFTGFLDPRVFELFGLPAKSD
jgi:Sigma-70, region 4